MKNYKSLMRLDTPFRLIVALGLLVSLVELFIMSVLADALAFLNIPAAYWGLIDAALLVLFIFPVFYTLFFQKLQGEERYRQANDAALDAIVLINDNNEVSSWNPAAQKLFLYSSDEVLGHPIDQLFIQSGDADESRMAGKDVQTGTLVEARARRKNGSAVPVEMSYSSFRIRGKKYEFRFIRDISERKQAEASLNKLSLAVEQSPNSVVITDLDGNIEYTNQAFTKVTGYSAGEVMGKNPRILQSGKTPAATFSDMWLHLTRGDTWNGELINRRKDGSEYIESTVCSPVRQEDGHITNYLAIKTDITEQKQAEARIERLAHFDQLTGLPNRSQLNDRLKYALSIAQRNDKSLTVMLLDIDHFKNINDTLGYEIGDQVLIEMAERLSGVLRDEDTVSRQSGDEFILVLPDAGVDGATCVAIKLMELLSTPFQFDQNELIITPSIGIAIYPNDGNDLDTLTQNAETAMYRAKKEGRNNFCFFMQEMQTHSARTLQLSNALHHALTRNELQLHYQPQVSAGDGHIVGAEALLRWRHPVLGNISPAEFIPIAENGGQIIQIGEWVIRTACKQLKDWMDDGLPPMIMAVNLSAIQFHQANITERIISILDEMQLPHEYLEVELTEAVAMDDPVAAIAVMDKLHEQGIRMSIDDFGTGYSSLSYLKKFKVYKLKIDQSFVRDITEDSDDKAIVTAIINLAHSLSMQTIAEGVETIGQLSFLRLQGCDEMQGYYFSKPLPAEQFAAYVKEFHSTYEFEQPEYSI